MNEVTEALNVVLSEFASEEKAIQEKIQNLQSKRVEYLQDNRQYFPLQFETLEDASRTKENALKRNKALRRDLNISLSKFRSKLCYNPAEDNLNKMVDKYSEILSREDID